MVNFIYLIYPSSIVMNYIDQDGKACYQSLLYQLGHIAVVVISGMFDSQSESRVIMNTDLMTLNSDLYNTPSKPLILATTKTLTSMAVHIPHILILPPEPAHQITCTLWSIGSPCDYTKIIANIRLSSSRLIHWQGSLTVVISGKPGL